MSMIMKSTTKILSHNLPASNTDSFTIPSDPLLVMTIFGDWSASLLSGNCDSFLLSSLILSDKEFLEITCAPVSSESTIKWDRKSRNKY